MRPAGSEKPEPSRPVALLRAANEAIDAAARLAYSCARLVRALTALVVAVAILFVVVRTLW